MSTERLKPLEALEKDYYLDERSGWYSDGEQRDSESSDDEFRAELSKLAGVRCEAKKGFHRQQIPKKKDEFESDMDDELNECFVAHASRMFSSPTRESGAFKTTAISKIREISTDDEIPALVSDTDDEALPGTSNSKVHNDVNMKNDILSSARRKNSGEKVKKSVSFAREDWFNTKRRKSGEEMECSFVNENSLLRKAVDKAAEVSKKETVDFYDSYEDEDNERWVRQHREQLKIVKPRPISFNASDSRVGLNTKKEKDEDGQTDAVLSCPACMSLLTRDCQRHDIYRDQYRAIFVENCSVVEDEMLFLPQSGKNKRKARKNVTSIKPNATVSPADVAGLPREDLFHPVRCSVCSTNVGVYDSDEVFHFFNVLSGYA